MQGLPQPDMQLQFREAEEKLRKGAISEALRIFQDVYDRAKAGVAAMDCVKSAYIKLGADVSLEQDAKEDLFIRLQRIASLKPQYVQYRNESAYYIGLIHARLGDNEQARKYLLEVCQSAPVSREPASLWMKAKTLLLETLYIENEF